MTEELRPEDVESYTGQRLSADDPEVQRALDAALARARRYCAWHVSPVQTETFVLDGDGSERLSLPTLAIESVDSITVNGVVIDPSEVASPAYAPYVLIRRNRWPRGYSNIAVTVAHGYSAADCPDWREAVLRMVDQIFAIAENEGLGALTSRQVDDVTLRWASGGVDSDIRDLLDGYRRKWFCA